MLSDSGAEAGEVTHSTKRDSLSWGGSAILELLPAGHVVKTPTSNPWDPFEEKINRFNMRLEARIYDKIGQNPRVPQIIRWHAESDTLTMEFLENGKLREYVRENHASIISELRL